MISSFKNLLFTGTGKDTTIVFVGTLVNVIIGGLFFILAPRILGPADYGLFSTVVATGIMVASIANFGLDTGILRFAKKDSDQLNKVLSLAFKSYLIFGLTTAILGIFVSRPLANFLGQPNITQLLQIAFVGTIFILLSNFFVAALQAKQEFLKASIVNISSNLARLILLLFALYFFSVGIYSQKNSVYFLTALFFFVTIISSVIGRYYLSFKFEKTDKSLAGKYFKYNIWVAAALIISSIPFDNYFLLKLAGPVQTGLYAAPFKILTFVYQFGGNFTRVLASRFASFDTDQKAIRFSVKAIFFPLLFATGLVILILIASPIISILFGKQYLDSVQILRILSIGFIFFFVSTIPSSLILYYFGKSSVSFIITSLRYILFITLLIILIPSQKAVGAALAFSIAEFVAFLLMSIYVILKFAKVINDKH